MKDEPNGVRTHEPSLRELTAELDGMRDLLLEKIEATKGILDERDKLYTERALSGGKAVDAALKAAETLTNAAFAASEKAIVKAEEAQKSYNQSHNDLARKMDEQGKATMPRPEVETRFHSLEEKIGVIRDALAASGGVVLGGKAIKDDNRTNIGIIVAVVAVVVAMLSRFIK